MAVERIYAPNLGGFDAGHDDTFASNFDPHLKLTVVHTSPQGTLFALRVASALARDLCVQIGLVATQVVPFRLPLEEPLVSTNFLEQRQGLLVSKAGIDEGTVTIQICLCRDPKRALKDFLAPRSLIVLGGKRGWWRAEQRLGKWLSCMGHQVIFADIGKFRLLECNPSASYLRSHL
jgi:hypothetical protein